VINAFTVPLEIGAIERFASRPSCAATQAVPQSGATDRRGPISKHGPKYVRWTLFEAAMNACKHPVYTECYQHQAPAWPSPRSPQPQAD
jgi:transposase